MTNVSPKSPPPNKGRFGSLSFRARLIIGNISVAFLAVAALSYYVYYHAQTENAYLSGQLDISVQQRAKDQLSTISTEQANALDNFFASAKKDIVNLGATTEKLLSQETVLGSGTYWNAAQQLYRLPNGNWDNPRSDAGSVFMPANVELNDPLTQELNTVKQLDFVAPTLLKSNPDAIAVYFGGVPSETIYYPNVDLASLVPPDFDITKRPWFVKAAPAQNPSRATVWSDPYLDAAQNGLVITGSVPVFDPAGNFRGAAAMDFQLNRITTLVSSIKVGDTGYAFLVDKDQRLIAMPPAAYADLGIAPKSVPLGESLDPSKAPASIPAEFWAVLTKMNSGQSGLEIIEINEVKRFVVYHSIPEVGYNLIIIVPTEEMLTDSIAAKEQIAQSFRSTLLLSGFLVVVILLIALIAALTLGNRLVRPLGALTKTAEEITSGNLEAEAEVHGQDEISVLATAFNAMTARLRNTLQGLEQRVIERTTELQIANKKNGRRAEQFEAIAQVGHAINSIRRTEELLPRIASVISEHFGYYHVGIFLNDENNLVSYLTASNSEGGKKMLARGHNLKIGEQGIVGYVANAGQPRIASSVGEDAVFFNNPDLPDTKSEMALPLRSGGKVVGVLDVQSREENAFSEDDINVLNALADQVTLAIDNSRLYESTRRSLEEAEALYRQYLRQAWNRLPREQQLAGYHYDQRGATPLEVPVNLDAEEKKDVEEAARFNVPIKLRGETIGNLVVQVPQGRAWGQDQIDLVEAVAERVALSAENARLFDETSRRAERERMVTEITSKIRSTNDPEAMIRTALDELRNALGATQVQLIPQAISASQKNQSEIISSTPQDPAQKAQRGNGAKK
ncbi:MAG: GAF domain-containing protein [Chloroflexi bacterium]|nr:GAF domain-containing protein [Chloroflexota bacterium]MBI3339665.1 GAF domain-containing protein [Chloroflexota bacterium]